MRKIIVILLLTIGLVLPIDVYPATISLRWDANDPEPMGYRVFQRLDGKQYDYLQPAWDGQTTTTTIVYPDPIITSAPILDTVSFGRLNSAITFSWTQPETTGESSRTDFWVVRAYEGDLESADSNEVTHTVNIKWTVTKWRIYYSETAGGPYTLLDTISDSGEATLPFDAVADGETKIIYFAIVAFDDTEHSSPNSNEVAAVIDRRPIQPPSNFSITAFTPVE